MAISGENDKGFFFKCCFFKADLHNGKKYPGITKDRTERVNQGEAYISGKMQSNQVIEESDMFIKASAYATEEDNKLVSTRILYNANGEHAQVSDIYPFLKSQCPTRNESLKAYEWQVFLMNRWLPYQHLLGQKVEELFCWTSCQDRKLLSDRFRRNWWHINSPGEFLTVNYRHYKICPLFMLQRNLRTGKERPIRRLKIERGFSPATVGKCYPGRRAKYSHYPSRTKYKVHFKENERNPRIETMRRSKKGHSHDKLKSKRESAPEFFFKAGVRRSKDCDEEISDVTRSSSISCVSEEEFANDTQNQRLSSENIGSTENISEDTLTWHHEQRYTAKYESEHITSPKYAISPRYTELQMAAKDGRFFSERSNKSCTSPGLNRMDKHFISEEITREVITDRESYTVSPPGGRIFFPRVDRIPNLSVQPQLSTMEITPAVTERGRNKSIGNNEKKLAKCPIDMSSGRLFSPFPPAPFCLDGRVSNNLIMENDDKSSSVRDCSSACSENVYGDWSPDESYSTKEGSVEEARKVSLSDMMDWDTESRAQRSLRETAKIYI